MEEAWTRLTRSVGARALTRLLAVHLWVLWVGWPSLVAGAMDTLTLGLSAGFALTVFWATPSARPAGGPKTSRLHTWRSTTATGALLVAAPAMVAGTLAGRPEAVNLRAFGSNGLTLVLLLVAAAGLIAYGAAALEWDALRHQQGAPGPTSELPSGTWSDAAGPRRPVRGFQVALLSIAGVALVLVAPHLGGYEPLARRWGLAADEGGLLAAVMGASLGTAVVAVYLADSLREATRSGAATAGRRRTRVAGYLLVALAAGTAYLLLKR